MLDFAPRTIINGALMRNFISQPVSIMVHVEQEAEKYCKSFQAKTTDNLTIDVVLNDPLNTNIKGWIEVIGVPSGPDTIRSKEIILFSDESTEPYDTISHNHLVTFMNNCKEIITASKSDY